MRFATLATIFTTALLSTGSVVAHQPSNSAMSRRSELVNAVIDELFARGYLDEDGLQSRGYDEFDARELGDDTYYRRAWKQAAQKLPWDYAYNVASTAAKNKEANDKYQAQASNSGYGQYANAQAQQAAQQAAQAQAQYAQSKYWREQAGKKW